MKRYRLFYLDIEKTKLCWLSEISKSGIEDGVSFQFGDNGRKFRQENWRNGRMNGVFKIWHWFFLYSKPHSFRKIKINRSQGIKITFNFQEQ